MKKITTIEPCGLVTDQVCATAPLELLQQAVGGRIEPLPHFDKFQGRKCQAYVNDEGMIDNLPINHLATRLWKQQLDGPCWYDPIVFGTLVIVQTIKK